MNDTMASIQLYHPRGPKVFIPLGPTHQPSALLEQVSCYLDAGFLVAPPGLEAGEEKESVGFVLHGELERDGKSTPFLLLYSTNDAMKWSFLKTYLNKTEQIEDFEFASGLKLHEIPLYIGNDKPERGKSSRIDQFIKPCKPFVVVFKANPKWNKEDADAHAARKEIYAVPKRLFVRWGNQRPQVDHEAQGTPTAAPAEQSQAEPPKGPVSENTRKKLATKPDMAETTKLALWWLNEAKQDHPERAGSLDALAVYANERGWIWETNMQCYGTNPF